MSGMTIIVKTIARWVGGMILLFGIYIVSFGHLTPGGGFAGGVIIACAYILLTLAHGSRFSLGRLNKALAAEMDSTGALLFLLLALLGVVAGGHMFFANFLQKAHPQQPFRLISAGIIPLCNVAIGLKVGMGLFVVFIIMSTMRVVVKADAPEIANDKRSGSQ